MKKQEQRELAIEAYTLGCKDVSSGKGGLKTFLESRGLSEELEVEPKPTQMTIVQLEKLTGIEKLEIVK